MCHIWLAHIQPNVNVRTSRLRITLYNVTLILTLYITLYIRYIALRRDVRENVKEKVKSLPERFAEETSKATKRLWKSMRRVPRKHMDPYISHMQCHTRAIHNVKPYIGPI